MALRLSIKAHAADYQAFGDRLFVMPCKYKIADIKNSNCDLSKYQSISSRNCMLYIQLQALGGYKSALLNALWIWDLLSENPGAVPFGNHNRINVIELNSEDRHSKMSDVWQFVRTCDAFT